mgnify:CR=1 FL=1
MSQVSDSLVIAGTEYQSRLLVGTGKYKDMDETRAAIEASGAEIVTVAVVKTRTSLICWISSRQISTRFYQTRLAVIPRKMPCVLAG